MKKISTFALLVILAIATVQNPFSQSFMAALSNEANVVMKNEDALLLEIEEKKAEYEIAPIDARIDRVWKAVPGYNGLIVDVEASYDKMKKLNQFDEKLLVFKEVSPQIKLTDLEPAPIYKGNEEKPMVTFLINVAWGNEYIPSMLKTLAKHKIKTTFFLDGTWVSNNQPLVTMIYEQGHEIGNHAYSHPNMSQLTVARMDDELRKTNEAIRATIDETPEWFGPPSGDYNQTVVERAALEGMRTVLWTVDTIDWKKPNHTEMVSRVLSKVHNGAMILMHPTEPTEKGLEALIQGIYEQGYEIGTVSQVLSEKRVQVIRN